MSTKSDDKNSSTHNAKSIIPEFPIARADIRSSDADVNLRRVDESCDLSTRVSALRFASDCFKSK